MPVDVEDWGLLAAGLALAGSATVFYKRKQTRAFKWAYFLTWPTLGTAVLLTTMPDRESMEQVRRGTACGEQEKGSCMGELNRWISRPCLAFSRVQKLRSKGVDSQDLEEQRRLNQERMRALHEAAAEKNPARTMRQQ